MNPGISATSNLLKDNSGLATTDGRFKPQWVIYSRRKRLLGSHDSNIHGRVVLMNIH